MKDCRDCKFCSSDPDGLYCSHSESQNKSNIFGRSIVSFRRDNAPCGPNGVLFEMASDEMLMYRGRVGEGNDGKEC